MKLNESLKKNIQETFQKIKTQASALWQVAREGDVPYILVGTATCGRASGSFEVFKAFKEEITKYNLNAHVISVGCMGHCYAEPLVAVRKPGLPSILYGNVSPPVATTIVKHFLREDNFLPELMLAALDPNDFVPSITDFPRFALETRTILRDFGIIDPENIMDYIARGGYEGLSVALQGDQETIIANVLASGLRGLGGAGFLTGEKWDICFKADGNQKYVIC
ncbi:MAG TPA: NADH-quinone oxidoreductase subunit F, partial [Thermodesulfobacteriota bacterium]|nr:NADH-quinone oxidoreductase subunit F [Thermodesulfobacteriota bacterium]